MKARLETLALSLFIVVVVVGIGLGFLFGIDNPVPWILVAVLVALPFVHQRLVSRRFVRWRDEYRIGIEAIDDDHRRLLTLINNLQTAVHYPTGDAFERRALEELVDYTKYHFAREEELMRTNDFPGYEEHKREHDEMISRVDGYLEGYQRDPEGTIEEVARFLKGWLVRHIAGTDQKYAPFLLEKGVR